VRADLESEQQEMRSILKNVKKIDEAWLNASDIYGSIKGIVGSAVQRVNLLELPEK
jgi:hypothetical protein